MQLVHDASALRVQAKLPVSRPGDHFEEEADRIADGVAIGGGIQRSAEAGATQSVPTSVHHALASSGQPLDAGTRSLMESRLGHDFSSVRVHADPRAGRSARDIGALAYTSGRDIVFAPGQFAPGATAGRRLLAHELTHVVQQRGGIRGIQRKTEEKTPCAVHAYDNSNPKDTAVVKTWYQRGIAVTSVPDMISKVNAYVDEPKNNCSCINRLEINGHGTDGYQSVGNGNHAPINDEKALAHDSTEDHLQTMASIKFCDRGVLMLLGCHVGRGNGKTLLHRLSSILPGKLIGGSQHYTGGRGLGNATVLGGNDKLNWLGRLPLFGMERFEKSAFVRWYVTIDGKEYVINGDEADRPENKAKLEVADKIKVKTPDGKTETIK